MTQPATNRDELPRFSAIRAENVEPTIRALLDAHRERLAALLQSKVADWDGLIVPLEEMQHQLARTWSPVGHMNGVVNSDALRAAYNACLPLLTAWHTDLAQNEQIFHAYEHILAQQGEQLTHGQRKLLENGLRDFRLAGVALPAERKQRFKDLMEQLASLQAKFDENVMDATNAWSRHVTDGAHVAGLPAPILERARAAAQSRQLEGWYFTLDAPNYQAVMMHAEHAPLRREFYEGWVTRASDQGAAVAEWNNGPLMSRILAVRGEIAAIIGYPNYAEYSLATKMASDVKEVRKFLDDMARQSKPVAQREYDELTHFAEGELKPSAEGELKPRAEGELHAFAGHELQAWDVAFHAERLKRQRFDLSEEALRPYFPLPRVLVGLFSVAEKLYDVSIVECKGVDVYHPDVHFYDILDKSGALRGSFYTDLYAREKKRGGAWMDECVGRKHLQNRLSLPVAYLVCNFMPPGGTRPSLLTHSEVVTLFHEFGHGLHHMLTRVDYPSIAGINGVAWDAVELPSQFMENFAWREEVLPLISGHVDSGEPLPQAELQRLLGTRTFHAGMQTVRQLEFALFDLRIHSEPVSDSIGDQTPTRYRQQQATSGPTSDAQADGDASCSQGSSFVPVVEPVVDPIVDPRVDPGVAHIMRILDEVRAQVAVVHPPAFNRFAHSFQHIFSGGYAAGYYSYKWAEVLAADAFSAFEESGIFDHEVSRRFLSAILEQGGSRDAMEAFVEFRGRKPRIEPLLKQLGLAA